MSCTPQSLMALAKCFVCPNHKIRQAVQTYLLCQWASSNLIPQDAQYDSFPMYNLNPLLTDGKKYTLTPGVNDSALEINGVDTILTPGVPVIFTFHALGTYVLIGLFASADVTARLTPV